MKEKQITQTSELSLAAMKKDYEKMRRSLLTRVAPIVNSVAIFKENFGEPLTQKINFGKIKILVYDFNSKM